MTRQPQPRIQTRRALALVAIATLALPGPSLSAPSSVPVKSAQQPNQPVPPRTVLQKLRELLGLTPPIAVGGSRGGGDQQVCLLSPWPLPTSKGSGSAQKTESLQVGLSAPLLLAQAPLNEIRLERNEQLLWQQRASSTAAIEGPIPWPISPLRPGEVLTLKLRPRGAAGGDFAVFRLQATSAANLKANEDQVVALGSDPRTWYSFLEHLTPQQASTAAALLSSPNAPAELRKALQCSIH